MGFSQLARFKPLRTRLIRNKQSELVLSQPVFTTVAYAAIPCILRSEIGKPDFLASVLRVWNGATEVRKKHHHIVMCDLQVLYLESGGILLHVENSISTVPFLDLRFRNDGLSCKQEKNKEHQQQNKQSNRLLGVGTMVRCAYACPSHLIARYNLTNAEKRCMRKCDSQGILHWSCMIHTLQRTCASEFSAILSRIWGHFSVQMH